MAPRQSGTSAEEHSLQFSQSTEDPTGLLPDETTATYHLPKGLDSCRASLSAGLGKIGSYHLENTPPSAALIGSTNTASSAACLLRPHFVKTKMCPYVQRGFVCSRGSRCLFAHSREDLRPLPDLRQTRMCPQKKQNGECTDPTCPYAHAVEELKHTLPLYKT
ncbi:zinc finger ccch domain-containing related [Cyclospora cayetanensis]|uniref:Zinc finger ccch domain-containing related n=1 Tax=Cyclospora cayetanensis TaxID=88456 RepID=A0A1D3D8L3_9EIME|nr:zinc finger ccch domain-containing related [Cyclospora cayetanensis]